VQLIVPSGSLWLLAPGSIGTSSSNTRISSRVPENSRARASRVVRTVPVRRLSSPRDTRMTSSTDKPQTPRVDGEHRTKAALSQLGGLLAVRDRTRGRRRPRRHGRALPAHAGADDPDGPDQLVHAALARPRICPRSASKEPSTTRHATNSNRRRLSRCRPLPADLGVAPPKAQGHRQIVATRRRVQNGRVANHPSTDSIDPLRSRVGVAFTPFETRPDVIARLAMKSGRAAPRSRRRG
jgi:hypothetical protein